MFENIVNFFKKVGKKEQGAINSSNKTRETAKERLHLVLMQDRANVSADFLEMMKQEIIEVIKKYIDVDEKEIDVRLTNKTNDDGTTGAPALYANIPIVSIKDEVRKANIPPVSTENKQEKTEEIEEKQEPVEEIKSEEPVEEKIEKSVESSEETIVEQETEAVEKEENKPEETVKK